MKSPLRILLSTFVLTGIILPLQAIEVPPAKSHPCFPGAYYRKAVSSIGTWTGIEGIVTLPEISFDPERKRADGSPKDNASVYLGGRVGEQEIDAGVSWSFIRQDDGTISKERVAFCPFWRNNTWYNAPAEKDFYYYPGDVLRMKVETVTTGKLTMRIDLLTRAENAHNLKFNDSGSTAVPLNAVKNSSTDKTFSTLPADALTSFTVTFDAPGFSPNGLQEFKRVNAIDMFDNEGIDAAPTKSRVSNSEWHEVYLLKDYKRFPFTKQRFTDMRCPDEKHIEVTTIDQTGERINLIGETNRTFK